MRPYTMCPICHGTIYKGDKKRNNTCSSCLPKPHGNTGNKHASKARPLSAPLSFRVPPELKQALTSRAEDGNANNQARRDLLELYGLT